jgi:hypothetical protein
MPELQPSVAAALSLVLGATAFGLCWKQPLIPAALVAGGLEVLLAAGALLVRLRHGGGAGFPLASAAVGAQALILGTIGLLAKEVDRKVVTDLLALARDREERVRMAAVEALKKIDPAALKRK